MEIEVALVKQREGNVPRQTTRISVAWADDASRTTGTGHRGLLQTQFLHSFRQVLVIDLEDNLKAIIRSRKDI